MDTLLFKTKTNQQKTARSAFNCIIWSRSLFDHKTITKGLLAYMGGFLRHIHKGSSYQATQVVSQSTRPSPGNPKPQIPQARYLPVVKQIIFIVTALAY